MDLSPVRIDRAWIESRTQQKRELAKTWLEKADSFREDALRKERLGKVECKVCFYLMSDRAGGTAVTRRPCGICGRELVSGNTNVDVLCADCARENKLCKHCGGDLELKSRRNPRPYEEALQAQ